MSYSVTTLQTVADCDAMLTKANNDKAVLSARKVNLELERTRLQDNSMEADAKLPIVQGRLNAYNSVIPTLPAGPEKDKQEYLRRLEENRLFVLTNKKANYGSIVQLDGENELASLELELTEKDAFIAAINARKAAL